MKKMNSLFIKVTALVLIIAFMLPISAGAVEARASDYLSSYGAYVYPAGWGKVQVWVTVEGTNYMDEIGTLSIRLYESTDGETWTWVKTFQHADYPDMLGYNDYAHTCHVEYAGTIGRYYKAYVGVWSGNDGEGDTRYFWTSPKKATLFAG